MINLLFISFLLFGSDQRTRIAIIDTGLNINETNYNYMCEDGHEDYTNESLIDYSGHGSNIAGIIIENLDITKYCIVIYKVYNKERRMKFRNLIQALTSIAISNIKYVNFSSIGKDYCIEEKLLFTILLNLNIHISVAAGNDSVDLGDTERYPACYFQNNKYFHVIGNAKDDVLQNGSNYGKFVTNYENGSHICKGKYITGQTVCMSGTSMSTAIFTNKLVRGLVQ